MYTKILLMCISIFSVSFVVISILQIRRYDAEYLIFPGGLEDRHPGQHFKENFINGGISGIYDSVSSGEIWETVKLTFKPDKIRIKTGIERGLSIQFEEIFMYVRYMNIHPKYKYKYRESSRRRRFWNPTFVFKNEALHVLAAWKCPLPRLSHHLRYRHTPAPVTALASWSGSGSTWLRNVLHEATGILTVSATCDLRLRRSGFPEVCSDSKRPYALLENSHAPEYWKYARVVLLIRNPYEALLSSFIRDHVHSSKSYLPTKLNNKDWIYHIHSSIMSWQNSILGWLNTFTDDALLVVTYSDLKKDPIREITSITDFLDINLNKRDISCACVYSARYRFDEYINWLKKHVYTEKMIDVIDEAYAEVAFVLRQRFPDKLWNI